MPVPPEVVDAARGAARVVVVTGAGMSAESGVATFRDEQTGLWARYDAEDLASVEAWERDAPFVWAWYVSRFASLAVVEPNAGHRAVAAWAGLSGVSRVDVVTQNIDDLHERGGSDEVVHLHGSATAFRCESCDAPWPGTVAAPDVPVARIEPPTCPVCGARVRPGVVWFGEPLPTDAWDRAVDLVSAADLVLVVGTSGLVFPAAGLPAVGRAGGAVVVEINPVETETSDVADHRWRETAAVALPALVSALRTAR
ncbi:NAD-dependent deacylase [Terracoccus luteus]|nr:NAD-dependent deacylase [Terracoccus luteus]RKT80145.1 NAD-dependent deacetylase [Terracoccus luteus]